MDSGDWQHLTFALLALLVVIASGIVLTVVGQTTNQRLAPELAEHPRGHRSMRSMVNPRRAMASAMLFVQIIAAVIASGQVTHLIDRTTNRDFSWLAILLVAVIYVIFGLALPRAIADKQLDRLFTVEDLQRTEEPELQRASFVKIVTIAPPGRSDLPHATGR